MKKKIIFFVPDLSFGGAQRTFINLYNYFTQKKKLNYEVYLLVLNYNKNYSFDVNKINVINLEAKRTIYSFFKFIRVLKNINPDFIVSTTIQLNLLLCFVKSLHLFNKIKFFIRETNPTFERSDINLLNKILIKFFYPKADLIICLSKYVEKSIKKEINITQNRIIQIYNPINIDDFLKKIRLKNKKSKLNFLFVGRLTYQKNPILFLEVLSKIKYKNYTALIVGNGPYLDDMHKLIKKQNLQKKIKIFNDIQNISDFFIKSDIFFLTSRWEGFGHVIIESILSKTPVIAFDCPGSINELILSNHGWIIDTYDSNSMATKLDEIINSREYLIKPFNYNKFINQFDTKNIAKKYEKLFA